MKTILAFALLLSLPLFATAQESLVERVHKMEKRLDGLETKMDRVLDFLSANYGPNTKQAPKATTTVCDPVTGVCSVPTTSAVGASAGAGGCASGILHGRVRDVVSRVIHPFRR